MYPPGLQISNRFQALNDEDESNVCPVDKQWTSGRITWTRAQLNQFGLKASCPRCRPSLLWDRRLGLQKSQPVGTGCPTFERRRSTSRRRNSSITFQVTKVKKPLAAVSKITEKGNWVCFGPSGAYIENVATGKRTNLELHNGTYSLDVEHFDEPGFYEAEQEVRNSTKPSKPESLSPCGAEICVDTTVHNPQLRVALMAREEEERAA